jgi:rRNA biogenesis protein RRP5
VKATNSDKKKSRQNQDGDDDDEPAPRTTKSVLSQKEKAFPRGGASVLTPLERKQIQIQADRDALFEESGGKKRSLPADVSDDEDGREHEADDDKPKKKRKTRVAERTDKSTSAPAESVDRIESLSFRKLVPGSLVLGQVSQVTARDVALTLPNNLTGYVPLTSISQQLTARVEKLLEEADKDEADDDADNTDEEFEDVDIKRLFKVGQYLRAVVVSNDEMRGGKQKRHLELSLDPRLTNSGLTLDDLVVKSTVQASVVSVEDGGLVMDLGIDGVTSKGFISTNDVGAGVAHTEMQEGAVLLCSVTGHSGNGRVVKLTSDVAKMGDTKKGQSLTNAPSVKSFLPGTVATVLVSEVSSLGIRGSIMGMIDVTADMVHSGGAQGRQDLEKKYKPGSKIDARVLFSIPKDGAQKIGVSVVEHLLTLSVKCLSNKQGASPLEQLALSTIVNEAKIAKIHPSRGAYLDLGIPRVYAFAHISQLSDKQVDVISEDTGPFKIGSVHKARIIDYNAMDGLFTVTLKESVLEEPFLRLEDVKAGQTVDGTIEDMPIKTEGIAGIRLKLSENIRGFVPIDHVSDIKLKHPERKYRLGMKVKARVLSVNSEKRSIFLTMKKALLGSEVEPWTNFSKLAVADQSPGTITKIIPTGAWVQFYGNVRGFLPVREMSEAFIKDPTEHFRVGQVVNVHIISIDHEGDRMLLSCKDPNSLSNERQEKFNNLEVGQLVDGSIIELGKEVISLELDGGVQGHLRLEHLTDGSYKKNANALAKMRAGMKLQSLLVLQKIDRSRTVRLTNKPSLVKAGGRGKLLTSLDQLKKGKEVHGFISSITTTGVFVEFGNNFSGLIPVAGMPEEMRRLRMQDFGMRTGESISAKVWNIYQDDGNFTLTLRDDEVVEPVVPKASTTLKNPIDEKLRSIDELIIGKQTLARVNAVKDLQLNVSLADNVTGRIHITEVFNDITGIKDVKKPLQTIKHNAILNVTITGLHQAKTSKFLPLTHRQSVLPVFECSHKQSSTSEPKTLSLLNLQEGDEQIAFIMKYAKGFAIASISPEISGTIDIAELASVNIEYENAFPIGSAVQTKIRSIDTENSKLHLAFVGAKQMDSKAFKQGGIYVGHVRRVHADGLDVQLSKSVWGLVPLTELADDFDHAKTDKWSAREAIKVKVLSVLAGKERLLLSARPSLTSPDTANSTVIDRHVTGNADVDNNQVLRGFVKQISKQGMLVRIGWNTIAQVPVHDLSDKFIKNYEEAFKPRQLVKGKIVKADASSQGHHKMSLRSSAVNNPNFKPDIGFVDLNVGDVVDAVVVKVEKYGVFIKVMNSKNVRGLCHVGELASTRVEDPSKLYSEGDMVKAKIIKLDKTKRHINFSLKALHFEDLPEEEAESNPVADAVEVDEDEEMGGVDLNGAQAIVDEEKEPSSDDDQDMADVGEQPASVSKVSDGLQSLGFDWEGGADVQEGDAAKPEVETNQPKKKRRKAEIEVDRTGELDALGPQSVSDFERLLLGQPNSSALWIQYMAFQLGLSEVDKAREVAERALKTIHMREEAEKMNIWIALLNLENTYGSAESLDAVFERAAQMSDKKEVYMRLASIFIESGKHKVRVILLSMQDEANMVL